MKKGLAIFLIWSIILSWAGCAQSTHQDAHPWGITLEVEEVSPGGLTIVCHQSGGEKVFDLMTGSYYVVQKLEQSDWVDVPYLPQEYDVAWTSEAWLIPREGTTRWSVNWKWLYGELPAGQYRIGKPVSNFRGTGDYESDMVYARFVIN